MTEEDEFLGDDFSVPIRPGSPEAIAASRAIRQIVTARLDVMLAPSGEESTSEDVLLAALDDVLRETLEGAKLREHQRSVLERVTYLLFAASLYGGLAVSMAASAGEVGSYAIPPAREKLEEVLSSIAMVLEETPGQM